MPPQQSGSPAVTSEPNLGASAGERPAEGARGWVKNLLLEETGNPDNPDMIGFPFRPTTVSVNTAVNDESMDVIGMSHQYDTYVNTSNVIVTFEIYMNALMMIKEGMAEGYNKEGGKTDLVAASNEIEKVRRFLQSICYPGLTSAAIIGSQQPPVILCIPGICCIRTKLKQLEELHERCDIDGYPVELRLRCVFKENPMSRITMEDVASNGLYRTWGV